MSSSAKTIAVLALIAMPSLAQVPAQGFAQPGMPSQSQMPTQGISSTTTTTQFGSTQPGFQQPGALPSATLPGQTQPGVTQPGLTQPGLTSGANPLSACVFQCTSPQDSACITQCFPQQYSANPKFQPALQQFTTCTTACGQENIQCNVQCLNTMQLALGMPVAPTTTPGMATPGMATPGVGVNGVNRPMMPGQFRNSATTLSHSHVGWLVGMVAVLALGL